MDPAQLKLLIAEGEGLLVEFKEKYTPKIDRDIVAFANTKGGRILLGVTDDGKIIGETLTNRLKAEILDLARKCEPPVEIKKISRIRTEITGADRKDIYEIPMEALREAVANAVVHRDYSMRGTSLMVEVHEDRVVVSNPGGFPAGMTEQKLGALSIRRNELIADIFARMNKVERMGSGFKRIREHLAAAGLPFPEMESDSFFVITFKRPQSPGRVPDRVPDRVPVKITANQEKILAAISEKHTVTIQELAVLVGISARKIKANIGKLKAAGLLKRIGADFGGHWEVTPK